MIKIKHNLDANKFKWLWCKYVQSGNDEKHCTNSLKGLSTLYCPFLELLSASLFLSSYSSG